MQQRNFPKLGERCYFEQLDNGLAVYVVPKVGYSKSYACFAVSYGGMNRRFGADPVRDTPAGIAHYLEHKMFDMRDGNALQTLSAAGASPNAFTSTDITAYHFSCTQRFEENLRTLLRFVSTPYFTPESVEKEQGIIAQEIGMLCDNPNFLVYQNLLQGMYQEHPIRESVIGTTESIAQITADTLYDCYHAFYHPDNMVLCVAGDVDPKRVCAIAKMILPHDRRPCTAKDYGAPEPRSVCRQEVETEMQVSAPLFLMGFKAPPCQEPAERLRHMLLGELAAEILCGEGSELYARLYQDNLINKSFGVGFDAVAGASMLELGGESKDPRAVRDAVLKEAEVLSRSIDPAHFRRALRGEYGSRVRNLNSFEDLCVHLARSHMDGSNYLDFGALYQTITPQDVSAFLRETVREDQCTLSVVNPKGGTQ